MAKAACGRQLFQQLVFLDLESGILFYRTPLRNTLTPTGFKRSVLRDMRGAHRELESGETADDGGRRG